MVEIKMYTSDENAISMLTRLAFKCGGVGATRRSFRPDGTPKPYVEINYAFGYDAEPSSFFAALANFGDKVTVAPPKE